MFPKLFIALVFATLVGGVLLNLRQQRLETMHEMVRMHQAMDEIRQQTWDLQTRISAQLEPGRLRDAIEQAGLSLEPAAPPPMLLTTPSRAHPRVAESETHYAPRTEQQ